MYVEVVLIPIIFYTFCIIERILLLLHLTSKLRAELPLKKSHKPFKYIYASMCNFNSNE